MRSDRVRRRARWRSCRCAGSVFLNDLLGLPQPRELRALYDAMDNATRNQGKRRTVRLLVERASRAEPRLIVIEDFHWADDVTTACLAELAVAAATCPMLLVLTSRVEGDVRRQAWRAQCTGAPVTTIDLGPLAAEDARSMARSYLAVDEGLFERCVERAAGNPLFLDQLLRHATESADARVPGSIQSLVQARLDRLDPLDRAALQAASVLGQRFQCDPLRYLLQRPDYMPRAARRAASDPSSRRLVPVFPCAHPRCRLRRTSQNPSQRPASKSGELVRGERSGAPCRTSGEGRGA